MIVRACRARQGSRQPSSLPLPPPPPPPPSDGHLLPARLSHSTSRTPIASMTLFLHPSQICLGPVCVPLHLLLPFLVAMVRPPAGRRRPHVGAAARDAGVLRPLNLPL